MSPPDIAVLKKVRYALCPMPYALCPMPYAHEYLIWELERLYLFADRSYRILCQHCQAVIKNQTLEARSLRDLAII